MLRKLNWHIKILSLSFPDEISSAIFFRKVFIIINSSLSIISWKAIVKVNTCLLPFSSLSWSLQITEFVDATSKDSLEHTLKHHICLSIIAATCACIWILGICSHSLNLILLGLMYTSFCCFNLLIEYSLAMCPLRDGNPLCTWHTTTTY